MPLSVREAKVEACPWRLPIDTQVSGLASSASVINRLATRSGLLVSKTHAWRTSRCATSLHANASKNSETRRRKSTCIAGQKLAEGAALDRWHVKALS